MSKLTVLQDHNGPATHALVIGVGAYRHFEGGTSMQDDIWGLRQIPGAAVSAKLFIEWLRANFNHPSVPLSTIEHLVTGPQGTQLQSEEPTMSAVEEAFDRWHARSSLHPDNIALLYFSGHGVLKGTDTGLLLSDFAKPGSANLVRNAVHVEATSQGMLGCKANRQCFIIDCCRSTEEPLVNAMTSPGRALATASQQDVRPIPQPILFATGLGQKAYSLAGAGSPFTKALLASLNGMGADDPSGSYDPGECEVNTTSLLLGIKAAMGLDRQKRPDLVLQDAEQGGHGSFVLHYPQEKISIPLVVGCVPASLNVNAKLVIECDGIELHSQSGTSADLELAVRPDTYHVKATIGPEGKTACKDILVTPPYRACRLSNFLSAAPHKVPEAEIASPLNSTLHLKVPTGYANQLLNAPATIRVMTNDKRIWKTEVTLGTEPPAILCPDGVYSVEVALSEGRKGRAEGEVSREIRDVVIDFDSLKTPTVTRGDFLQSTNDEGPSLRDSMGPVGKIRFWRRTEKEWQLKPLSIRIKRHDRDAVYLTIAPPPDDLYLLAEVAGAAKEPSIFVAVPTRWKEHEASAHVEIEIKANPLAPKIGGKPGMRVRPLVLGSALQEIGALLIDDDLSALEKVSGQLAERLRRIEVGNCQLAAAGALALLRLRQIDFPLPWTRTLADAFPTLPDASTIRAWHLLFEEHNTEEQLSDSPEERLITAARRGVPIFTASLKLMTDGLGFFRKESHAAAEALDRMDAFRWAADPQQIFTTFRGSGPDTPTWKPGSRLSGDWAQIWNNEP